MTSTTAACPVTLPTSSRTSTSSSASVSSSSSTSTSSRTLGAVVPGRLRVTGLWCTSCAHALEKAFGGLDGVIEAHVSFAAGEAVVRYDTGRTTLPDIAAQAARIGYGASVVDDLDGAAPQDDAVTAAINDLAVRLAFSLVFGMWAMGASWALLVVDDLAPATANAVARLAVAAAIPVVLFSGAPFLRAGFRTTRVGAPGMDALVSVGALLSLALSIWHLWRGEPVVYVDTATMLVTLLLTGRLIEHAARKKGAGAMRELLFGLPPVVRQPDQTGALTEVLARDVKVGDTVVALADKASSDIVAVDGVVIDGSGEVSTAMVSGEAVPVPVAPGSLVLAGSRVVAGRLSLRVTAGVGARRLDVLAARARELLVARDGLASLAERAARGLVPTVLLLAVAAAVVELWQGAGVESALVRAVSVVVVTCPCALGLATPAALLSASASARRSGIVFRDVQALEHAARLRTVAFDKTGTLTTGRLRLDRVERTTPIDDLNDDALVRLAAAIEGEVAHPVAEALRLAAGDGPRPTVTERSVTLGEGVQARLDDGRLVAVRRAVRRAVQADDEGLAVDLVRDGQRLATFTFVDELRDDTRTAIASLRARGVRVVILSGDTPGRALALGLELGLPENDIFGGLSPEGKLAVIETLREEGRVAFVGDGDNDAAALAAADLGIAVQGGTRAALEAAPVVLQQPGLSSVATALSLAGQTAKIMRQNLAFAVVFNAVMVPAAVVGVVAPLFAAVAMGTSSLVVTLNALRAR